MLKLKICLFYFFSFYAFATLPPEINDDEWIEKADHLLIGRVVSVEMIDDKGNQIFDPSARTGPKESNIIYYVFEIDDVIVTNEELVPRTIRVPLDKMAHYSLGQILRINPEVDDPVVVILGGSEFQPVYSGVFLKRQENSESFIEKFKQAKLNITIE